MTAPDPADVIEQAANVLVEHRLQHNNTGGHRGILGGWNRDCICGWHGVDHEPSDRVFEHHVAAQIAGLLADPADRVGSYGQPTYEDLRTACHLLGERLKRAEAEVARLQQWKDEASPVMIGLQDLGKALGIPLGTRITGEVAAEKARALNAANERVKALADAYETDATYEVVDPDGPGHPETIRRATGYHHVAEAIRAALDPEGGAS